MSAVRILKTLLKATGPINAFTIKNGYAAYTELRISSKDDVINTSVAMVKIVDSSGWTGINKASFAKEAEQIASNEGRIECDVVGRFGDKAHEKEASDILLRIATKSKYRKKHRVAIDKAIKTYKKQWKEKRHSLPDPHAPDTLGWRVWHWDGFKKRLVSPSQHTVWETPELRVSDWNSSDVVRGHAGIHAARMPYDWKRASLDDTELSGFYVNYVPVVTGIVERFGRYVLGTEGWRSEWVIIRALKAPSTEIGLILEQAYPDIPIFYNN